tara:strand:+ start:1172 stop:1372 length:201 start_codon:yes stop_codon:yes gene_type:complete
MAIKKHAMTKEGAILCITRNQVKQLDGKHLTGIRQSFIDAYKHLENSKIKELYKKTFDVELVIIEK